MIHFSENIEFIDETFLPILSIIGILFGESLHSKLFSINNSSYFVDTGKVTLPYLLKSSKLSMKSSLIDFPFQKQLDLMHHQGFLGE